MSNSSARKPFITLITMISAATPSITATQADPGDEEDEALALARQQIAPGDHPLVAVEDHAVSLASALSMLSSSRSPVARRLSSTTPFSSPCGPTIELPGQADQVHRRELGAAALVAVVVERLDAGLLSLP